MNQFTFLVQEHACYRATKEFEHSFVNIKMQRAVQQHAEKKQNECFSTGVPRVAAKVLPKLTETAMDEIHIHSSMFLYQYHRFMSLALNDTPKRNCEKVLPTSKKLRNKLCIFKMYFISE